MTYPNQVILRFTRVWGVKLNATLRHQLEKYATIQPDLPLEEAAYKLYEESKELLKGAGFNLRKFTSNSSQLRDKVEGEETPHSSDVNHNPPVSSNTNESEEDLHTNHSRRFSETSLQRAEDTVGEVEC